MGCKTHGLDDRMMLRDLWRSAPISQYSFVPWVIRWVFLGGGQLHILQEAHRKSWWDWQGMTELSDCDKAKPGLGSCVCFQIFSPARTSIVIALMWQQGTNTSLVQKCCRSHPRVVQMSAVGVAWMLELVHPPRGEQLTVIPKLGKNTKFLQAFAKYFVALQSHKWKKFASSKYCPASWSSCIKSNCQALVTSYYFSVHVSKYLILPVLTGLELGKTRSKIGFVHRPKSKCPDQAALKCSPQLSMGLLIIQLSKAYYLH